MKKIMLFCAMLVFSTPSISEPELKGSPNDLRGFLFPKDKIITLSADAEERAYSDKAIVSLVITTEAQRLSTALADNGALRESLTTDLISAGIDTNSIKSSKFSSSPQYGWFGKKPSSYKVVNRMAVSITQESHLKEIAAVADNNSEVELSDTSFEHTKKEEFRLQAKSKALDIILKQKKFYEESLGVSLSPIGIRDSRIQRRATRGAMMLEEVIVTASKNEKSNHSSVSAPRDYEEESSFDEVIYEANLAVDFKIEG